MKSFLFLTLLLISPFSASYAEDRSFLTVGAGYFTIDGGGDDVNPTNVLLRVGFEVVENIELGIEASTTVSEDDLGGFDYSADARFIFAKVNMPLGNNMKVYAIAGHSEVELTTSAGAVSSSSNDSGIGYGFGVQFERLRDASFFVEYISYFNDDEFDGVDLSDDLSLFSINAGFVSYF